MRDALIDTARRAIRYRDFVIQEAYCSGVGNRWEWAHESFRPGAHHLTGDCQTVFEAIDAVDAWYEQREAA